MTPVTLTYASNVGLGVLNGDTVVRTWRTDDGTLAVSLWAKRRHRIAEGLLHQRDGAWHGRVQGEGVAYEVTGAVVGCVLEFEECSGHLPVSSAAQVGGCHSIAGKRNDI